MPSSLLVFSLRYVLSLQASGPGTCVQLAPRPSLLEEAHTSVADPLRTAEVRSLPPTPPSPKKPFAPATLVLKRVDHANN